MTEVILVKYGEIALKGMNKHAFEQRLQNNLLHALKPVGKFGITRMQSVMALTPLETEADYDMKKAVKLAAGTFGVAAAQRCLVLTKNFPEIIEFGIPYLKDSLSAARTFKVEAKRSDKTFPLNSPAIQQQYGDAILDAYPHLTVDVHSPDVTVRVEIREKSAYLNAEKLPGAGGMPVGSSGSAVLLLSGGFDSPVAGYLAAKRGIAIQAVHFQSPPYTSERALDKVKALCAALSPYCGEVRLHIVPFTKLQETLRDNCPGELFTVLLRRQMYKIAAKICRHNNARAIITGECVGQVASQTLGALACTNAAVPDEIAVLRPVICFDKIEITEIAREIGTYDISRLPFEDCCTIFSPKHPKTSPALTSVIAAENAYDYSELLEEAYSNIEIWSN